MQPETQRQIPPAPSVVDPVAALGGFFRIMQAWAVGAEDARALLGSPPERTYTAWRAGRSVEVVSDTLRRIGYIAGIYKALQILYSDPRLADGWVRRPNHGFDGRTPLEGMRDGNLTDLAAIRSRLDAARAPWS